VETIFIQIAAYRDPELIKTINSAIKNARFAERLRFGIISQCDSSETLGRFEGDNRVRYVKVPWRESKGVGWARHECNKLYQFEDFTLQIDSHHRFAKDWDIEIIEMWKQCGHPKAVLSGYPPGYEYDSEGKEIQRSMPPMNMIVKGFDYGTTPTFKNGAIPNADKLTKPVRGCFVAAGFMFTIGKMCEEVPYCKDIYFTGEEIVHSIRLFTHGYRIFYPHKHLIWHLYERPKNAKHWTDFLEETNHLSTTYSELQKVSFDTVHAALLGQQITPNFYGKQNTLQEFEMYCGVSLRHRVVHPKLLAGDEPPFEVIPGWEDRVQPIKEYFVHLEIDTSDVPPLNDYNFWYFGFHTNDCNELVRDDIKMPDGSVFGKIDVVYHKKILTREKPSKYIIWPHSRSLGWQKRLVYNLPPTSISQE
jgi:hypothetical protein